MGLIINATMTPNQILHSANTYIAIPSLIIYAAFLFIIFLVIGLAVTKGESSKFWTIYLSSFVLGIILLITMIFIPEFTVWVAAFFS